MTEPTRSENDDEVVVDTVDAPHEGSYEADVERAEEGTVDQDAAEEDVVDSHAADVDAGYDDPKDSPTVA